MQALALIVVAALAATPAALMLAQDPAPSPATDQHRWLAQLVGDWTVRTAAAAEADDPPMQMAGTDETRTFGALWVQSRLTGKMVGAEVQAMMTLGYDARKKAFVGTWIDTMHDHMWVYEGQLDAGRKVLTLSAVGPSFDDPSKTANYRDIITIVDADTRTLTSEVQGPDGKWTRFMTTEYRRQQ